MIGISAILIDQSMVTPTMVINFSLAVAIVIIGLAVFFRRYSNLSAGLFFLICASAAFWVTASTMADLVRSPVSAEFWAKLTVIGLFFLIAFFLMMSFVFPVRLRRLSWPLVLLVILPSLAAILLSTTGLNMVGVTVGSWGIDFVPGPLYAALLTYIIAYLAIAIRNLVVSWKLATNPIVRKQLLFVLMGMTTMAAIGAITNLVLPLFLGEPRASVFGPVGAVFFVLFLANAIVRYRMLDLRVVAAEIFTFVLVIINFVEMLLAEGADRFILRSFLFIVSAATGIMLIRSVTREIARRQQLQRLAVKLDATNKELRHLDEMKSEFISIASHQLRTPVSVIKGYLSLIRDGAFGEVKGELKDKLEQIYDMNERLVHLINNLLNISRIERGAAQFWCSEVDVTDIIRRVVNEMAFKIRGRDISLSFLEPEEPVPNVVADPERVTEVLINLIDNAIKYSRTGAIKISVHGQGDSQPVLVKVTDTGIGMDPEDVGHVFEKFYHPHRPTEAHRAGLSLGLGLYICAKFLRSMGGDIWVESSTPGQGTTMAFVLPTVASGVCEVAEEAARSGQSVPPAPAAEPDGVSTGLNDGPA